MVPRVGIRALWLARITERRAGSERARMSAVVIGKLDVAVWGVVKTMFFATSHDVADELGISIKTASAILSALHEDGFIRKCGRTSGDGRHIRPLIKWESVS